MKIRKIMVNGFGKLTDRSYSLSDGLNVIYGNNEAGKSTLHRFIGAVFFGFFKAAYQLRITVAGIIVDMLAHAFFQSAAVLCAFAETAVVMNMLFQIERLGHNLDTAA